MEGSKEGTEGPSYLVRGGLEGRGQELLARRGKKEFPPKNEEVTQPWCYIGLAVYVCLSKQYP